MNGLSADLLNCWSGHTVTRPAVEIAEAAAHEFTPEALERAYRYLTGEAHPSSDARDERTHYYASPESAAELLADALLYEDLYRTEAAKAGVTPEDQDFDFGSWYEAEYRRRNSEGCKARRKQQIAREGAAEYSRRNSESSRANRQRQRELLGEDEFKRREAERVRANRQRRREQLGEAEYLRRQAEIRNRCRARKRAAEGQNALQETAEQTA